MPKKKDEEPSKEIVNWEQKMAEEAKAVAKTERATTGRVSFKSGILSYAGEVIKGNEMDVVILGSVEEHAYYSGPYDADNLVPPDCFALGEPGEPLFPHEVVPEPVHDNCDECPNFQWKSAGKGKACKEKRRLVMIPAPDSVEDLDGIEMATCTLPVMSVKNWGNYVNQISATVQRPPWGVITRLRVVPDPKSQFKVMFDLMKPLDRDFLPALSQKLEMGSQMLLQPFDMSPPAKEEKEAKKY